MTTAGKKRRAGRWYLPGILYDAILERPLVGIRKKVRALIEEEDLYPLVDICCGPGAQLASLVRVDRTVVRLGQTAARPATRPDPSLGEPVAASSPNVPGCERTAFGLDINFKFVRYASARRPTIPFICADASRLPVRPGAFRGALLSFALHEQEPDVRRQFIDAAASILAPGGRLLLVDFENPWDRKSRVARLYVSVIERLAGAQHFRLNRDFFRRGGLRALLTANGLTEVRRHDVAAGTCAIVLAAPRANVARL
jgi:ubiquinone/menaquinone biosynthesis C-methylase UbiE